MRVRPQGGAARARAHLRRRRGGAALKVDADGPAAADGREVRRDMGRYGEIWGDSLAAADGRCCRCGCDHLDVSQMVLLMTIL